MSLSDEEVKASILEFLVKKGRWGARYHPLDTMVRWLGKKVRRNGKRVRKIVKELVNRGYLLLHKRGEAVSLNPAISIDIIEYMERTAEGF
jgi:transcription antitermination factor NusA-like protein